MSACYHELADKLPGWLFKLIEEYIKNIIYLSTLYLDNPPQYPSFFKRNNLRLRLKTTCCFPNHKIS